MSTTANVASIEAVRSFRATLVSFGAEARELLCNQDLELRRGMQWLLAEQPEYWHREIRKANDAILEAKNDLIRCRGMTLPDGTTPSCTEEKQALEMARRRLAHAEEKAAATQKWGRALEHEALEYSSRATQLHELLDAMLPRAISMLDRSLAALEEYTTLGPPQRKGAPNAPMTKAAEQLPESAATAKTLPQPLPGREGSDVLRAAESSADTEEGGRLDENR